MNQDITVPSPPDPKVKGPSDQTLPALPYLRLGKPSGFLKYPARGLPPAFVIRLGLFLRHVLLRLADALVPASLPIFEQSTGVMQTMALSIVARHGIADKLGNTAMTALALAGQTGTDADVMHRILRTLASRGVFRLDQDGAFHNNRLSRALLSGAPSANREWVQYFGSQTNLLAWIDLERSALDGKSCFDRVFGETIWDWFEKHGEEQEIFAHSMMGISSTQAPIIAKLYPFQEVKSVCDIGGGRGTLLSEILLRHTHLEGMLYDAEGVLASADTYLKQRGLRERVRGVVGNFFTSSPAPADVYLLKNIFHDWDDEACSLILRNIRKSMSAGQRVLIIEQILEVNSTDRLAAASDLQMLVVCSRGRERSRGELGALLSRNGFNVGRNYFHPLIGIIEGVV